jgi:hypothetical protein
MVCVVIDIYMGISLIAQSLPRCENLKHLRLTEQLKALGLGDRIEVADDEAKAVPSKGSAGRE